MKKFILWLRSLSDPEYLWEYGTCNKQYARRNKLNGVVQFRYWKAGERGNDPLTPSYQSDFWIDFDRSWWIDFKTII